jgi:DNA-binding HxlR family transcriptional regulator
MDDDFSQVGDMLLPPNEVPIAAQDTFQQRPTACAIAQALDALGEGWTFLILRAAFFGAHRFSEFEAVVFAPKAQLTDGLKRLVRIGVFRHHSEVGYTLAEPGKALFALCIGFMVWGDKWAAAENEIAPPIQLAWRHDTGAALRPGLVCSNCGSAIDPGESAWRVGPGALAKKSHGLCSAHGSALPAKRRRAPDAQLFTRGQPCSVSRTLQKLGGYWGFLILREAFFGVKQFDEFVSRLGAARSVVAKRLNGLVNSGVLLKQSAASSATTLEPMTKGARKFYTLSPAGRELFPIIVALIDWGDQYVNVDNGPPLTLHHTPCGAPLHARLVDLPSQLQLLATDVCVMKSAASVGR